MIECNPKEWHNSADDMEYDTLPVGRPSLLNHLRPTAIDEMGKDDCENSTRVHWE